MGHYKALGLKVSHLLELKLFFLKGILDHIFNIYTAMYIERKVK